MFDFVFSVDVAHHLQDPARYFAAASRLLVPGGRICTVTDSERIIQRGNRLRSTFQSRWRWSCSAIDPIAQLTQLDGRRRILGLQEETVEFAYELTDLRPYQERAFSVLRLIPEEAWRRVWHAWRQNWRKGRSNALLATHCSGGPGSAAIPGGRGGVCVVTAIRRFLRMPCPYYNQSCCNSIIGDN